MPRDAKQAFRLNVDIRYIKSFVIIDHMVISKGAVKKSAVIKPIINEAVGLIKDNALSAAPLSSLLFLHISNIDKDAPETKKPCTILLNKLRSREKKRRSMVMLRVFLTHKTPAVRAFLKIKQI